MARKKSKRSTITKKHEKESSKQKKEKEPAMKKETLNSVLGVLILSIAILFILAGFDLAGGAGKKIYKLLDSFLGVGYWLIPFSLIIVSGALFKSFKKTFGKIKIVSSFLFFILSLTFIDILFTGAGGWLGGILSAPLVSAFDTLASSIFLIAGILASIFMIFDTHSIISKKMVKKLLNFGRGKDSSSNEVKKEVDDIQIENQKDKISETSLNQSAEKDIKNKKDILKDTEPVKKTEMSIKTHKSGGEEFMSDINSKGQKFGAYTPPPLSYLQKDKGKPSIGDVKASAVAIKRTLMNFGISVEMDEVSIGPTVTRYALKPAEGVRLSKILSLQSNLELALAVSPIRIEAPIPGKALVGIEVPNTTKSVLGLANLIAHPDFQHSDKNLLIALGRDIAGTPHYANIAKMPHILIAGATGAGKSVTIHDVIVSLLYRNGPDQLRLVMVDPKRVELTLYNGIPHLLTPVITNPKKAVLALKWLITEMDRRYGILESHSVRDIGSYQKNVYGPYIKKYGTEDTDDPDAPKNMPYIVAILDELADLMQTYPREMEDAIVRLAQMSRAVGIHLILSTQHPTVKVITGLIKANVPARIALQVASQIASRIILDTSGAEKLLGAGDMLYLSSDMGKPMRIQAPYISENEVKKIVKYLKNEYQEELSSEMDLDSSESDSIIFSATVGDDDEEEPLLPQARQIILDTKKASTTFLQRKLKVGYARAARIMDILEEQGVVGPANGSKPREILISQETQSTENTEENEATGNGDYDTEPENSDIQNYENNGELLVTEYEEDSETGINKKYDSI